MERLSKYITEKLKIDRHIKLSSRGKGSDNSYIVIKKTNTVKDYLAQREKDILNPANHLYNDMPKSHMMVGMSLESLLNCTFKENINTRTIKNLLWFIRNKIIEGKVMPKYGSTSTFELQTVNKNKDLLNKCWNLGYSVNINTREKNPTIFFIDSLDNLQYICNLEGFSFKPNWSSDAVTELREFVDDNYKVERTEDNVTLRIAFWNDRFSILKFQSEDKFIIAYPMVFARFNNTSDENNKYYYN